VNKWQVSLVRLEARYVLFEELGRDHKRTYYAVVLNGINERDNVE